jgi:hypothetical protein
VSGLANAVILAVPQSPFLQRWYDAYRSFDGTQWDYHSCKLPLLLHQSHPGEAVTLAASGFFLPQAEDMPAFLAEEDDGGVAWDFEDNWAVHMWNHRVHKSLERLFAQYDGRRGDSSSSSSRHNSSHKDAIASQRSSFGRLARSAWEPEGNRREVGGQRAHVCRTEEGDT